MVNIIQKEDLSNTGFSNDNSLAAGGIDVRVDAGSTVGDAIAAAIAAIPGDVFLQGLNWYDAATNILTLNMSDGSTVAVDMTALVNDAVAEANQSAAASAVDVYGNDGTTLLGRLLAP